ncbi:hypothetical protein Tco_0307975 [Tanacetum coccineum]
MQAQILKQNSMNKFTALKTTTQRLERKTFTNYPLFQRAFSHLFHTDFDKFIHLEMLKSSNYDSDAREARQDFKDYTQIEAQSFKDLIIQHMESIEQCIVERACHEQEIQNSRIVSDKGNDQGLENQSNTSGDERSRSRNVMRLL